MSKAFDLAGMAVLSALAPGDNGLIKQLSGRATFVSSSDETKICVDSGDSLLLGVTSGGHQRISLTIGDGATVVMISSGFKSGVQRFVISMGCGSVFKIWEARQLDSGCKFSEDFHFSKVLDNCKIDLNTAVVTRGGAVFLQQFNGKIGHDSKGTHIRQKTKVLKSGGNAKVMIEPNISVETPEAVASHGAAHGCVPEDKIHAMMAR